MERGYETVEEAIYIPEGFLLLVDLEERKVVLRKKEKEPIKGLKYQGWKLEFEGEVEEERDDNANAPKFNIGDWIVSDLEDVNEDFRLCKIIGIEDGCYTIQSANGCKGYNFFETWESDYHLWSIKDAKPGDVLCVKYGNDEMPFIFKGKQDDVAYCALNSFGEFVLSIAEWLLKTSVLPATNEQRDLLIQKMHEAGYTFDFEKKELKKLKFKVGDEVITENESSLTITKIDEEGYWSNDLFICDFDSECIWDLVKQKPTDEVEPKFKVGDNIRRKTPSSYDKDMQVARIEKDYYVCNHIGKFSSEVVPFSKESSYELIGQKPTECIKFNNEFENQISHLLVSVLNGEHEYNEGFVKYVAQSLLGYAKNELKSTEWSEEDERERKRIIGLLEGWLSTFKETCYAEDCKCGIEWLKSLRPQNHIEQNLEMVEALRTEYEKGRADAFAQMQKEWSEEDEEHVDSLLKRLEGLCMNEFERTRFAISEDVDWLKSLRPQNRWKPKTWEIQILESVIDRGEDPNNYHATLHGILEQLKKL